MSQIVSAPISTPVSVGNGGTGETSLTSGRILVGNGTSAIQSMTPGSHIDNATGDSSSWGSNIVTQFNALLAQLESLNILATS